MTRDPITPCGRGCCWTPFVCSRSRTCYCHAADPELPRNEKPVSRISYTDHTANNAIARAEGPRTRGGLR